MTHSTSKPPRVTAVTLSLGVALAVSAAAQTEPTRGAMAGFPVGFVYGLVQSGQTEPERVAEIWIQGTTVGASMTVAGAPGGGDPANYSWASLFGSASGPLASHLDVEFQISSLSSGHGLFTIHESGGVAVMDPTQNQAWQSMLFSVEHGAGDDGGHLSWASGKPNGNGSELMGFYVPGSNLPEPFASEPYWLEHSGIFGDITPFGSPGRPEIVAIDIPLGWIADPDSNLGSESGETLYFSLPHEVRTGLDGLVALSEEPENWNLPSPQTIPATTWADVALFRATWDGGDHDWQIDAFRTFSELGLASSDEIDALEVGRHLNGPDWLVYSIEGNGLSHDEVFAHQSDFGSLVGAVIGAFNGAVELPNGDSLPLGIGLDLGSELNGICFLDPEVYKAVALYGAPAPFPIQHSPASSGSGDSVPLMTMSVAEAVRPGGRAGAVRVSGWGDQDPSEPGVVALYAASYQQPSGGTVFPPSFPPVTQPLAWATRNAYQCVVGLPPLNLSSVPPGSAFAYYATFATNTNIANNTWWSDYAVTPTSIIEW